MVERKIRILVVDDEESMCETLEILFKRAGHEVITTTDPRKALEILRQPPPLDLVITDLVMPQVDGMEVLKASREASPQCQVIVITAHSTTSAAVSAMKLGAYDYIQKPFSMSEMRVTVEKALEKGHLLHENITLRRRVSGKVGFEDIVATSRPMLGVIETLTRVAHLPTNVLITGESGTGKELLARAIHSASPRGDRPFVVVDCGAIPESLMESELFGHVKGAYTGASDSKMGLIRAASGGTLFLDEIGELPPSLQVKLLRAIQERTIKPVGTAETVDVDIRIIAATNQPLEAAIESGRFRSDLYYRLNVIRVDVPPLRDRPGDIEPLCKRFIERFNNSFGKMILGLDPEALDDLLVQRFPGNVRELSNIIERSVALETADRISLATIGDGMSQDLPMHDTARTSGPEMARRIEKEGIDCVLGSVESTIVTSYWHKHGGNRRAVAKALGITVRSLRYRLAKYGIASGTEDDDEEA